jgi:hypothetical protein
MPYLDAPMIWLDVDLTEKEEEILRYIFAMPRGGEPVKEIKKQYKHLHR